MTTALWPIGCDAGPVDDEPTTEVGGLDRHFTLSLSSFCAQQPSINRSNGIRPQPTD